MSLPNEGIHPFQGYWGAYTSILHTFDIDIAYIMLCISKRGAIHGASSIHNLKCVANSTCCEPNFFWYRPLRYHINYSPFCLVIHARYDNMKPMLPRWLHIIDNNTDFLPKNVLPTSVLQRLVLATEMGTFPVNIVYCWTVQNTSLYHRSTIIPLEIAMTHRKIRHIVFMVNQAQKRPNNTVIQGVFEMVFLPMSVFSKEISKSLNLSYN